MVDFQRIARAVVAFALGLFLSASCTVAVAQVESYPAVLTRSVISVGNIPPSCGFAPGTIHTITEIIEQFNCLDSAGELKWGDKYCGPWVDPSSTAQALLQSGPVWFSYGYKTDAWRDCVTEKLNAAGVSWTAPVLSCIYGGTLSGEQCIDLPPCPTNQVRDEFGRCAVPTCPPGLWRIGGECVPPPCGTGSPYGDERYTYNPVTDRCTFKCSVALKNVSLTLPSGAAGKDFCMWAGGWSYCRVRVSNIGFVQGNGDVRYPVTPVADNSFCETATTPDVDDPDPEQDPELEVDNPASPDDEPLPDDPAGCVRRGGTWGTFNGTGMCLQRGTPGGMPTETTDRVTVNNGDGTTTTTTTTTRTDGDGNVTVIRTIITVGNGQTITEGSTVTGDRGGICAQMPALAICQPGGGYNGGPLPGNGNGSGDGSGGGGGDSVFGGSCEAGFQCDGDAIQCAIALEQHRRNCELFTPNDGSDTYAAAMAGEDPGQAALDPVNREEVALDSIIDDSSFLGGSCIEDRDFSVMGQTITIPLSSLCPYLDYMGMVVLAFAMLAAMRILFV